MWEPVIERLAAEREVIAIDLPGFGASPPLANGAKASPQELAAAVARFLDQLGIERAHVAGNSLGGWVALELARAGLALSVASLCSAGFWRRPLGPRGGPDIRRLGRALLPVLPTVLRSRRGRRLLLRGAVGHPERVPPGAAERMVRAYICSPGFESANAAMRAAVFAGAEQIEVPVTLAWGELDRLVSAPSSVPRHWQTDVLRDCGHIPTWDDPEQVARVLLQASS